MKEIKFLNFDPSKYVDKYANSFEYFEVEYQDPKTFQHELISVDVKMCSIAGKISAKAKSLRNEPIGWDGWEKEKLKEMCKSAGHISTNKNSKWWYNGTDYKFVKNCLSDEWKPSSAPNNPGKKTLNTKWWNNGIKHKRSVDCPGKGWFEGRINKGNLGGARIQTAEANLKRSIAMKKHRSKIVDK